MVNTVSHSQPTKQATSTCTSNLLTKARPWWTGPQSTPHSRLSGIYFQTTVCAHRHLHNIPFVDVCCSPTKFFLEEIETKREGEELLHELKQMKLRKEEERLQELR